MSFDTLGLSPHLLAAIADAGYTRPTPIQSRAIPAVIDGADVLGAAQTGTGKTAAFVLPILERLGTERAAKPRVLVLTPTRELAAQVGESVATYSKQTPLKHTVVFGGVGYQPQIAAFKRGVDIVVATPGRLLDHLAEGRIDFSALEVLVLDEADRMLDMGFIHDIKRLMKHLPAKRQTLLFSATFSNDIRKLAGSLLQNPVEIDVAPRNATAEAVTHRAVMVEKSAKRAVLSHLVTEGDWHQVLVFTRTKHGANRLVKQLETDGLSAAALHGNKSQNARTRALSGFKSGEIRVLVATDIAARGIDIDGLPHVINHELPNVAEDYVHRIGRTGRAGAAGEAISLVGAEERSYLKAIEKLIGHRIERMTVDGVDVGNPEAEPETKPAGRGNNGSRKRGKGNGNQAQGASDKPAGGGANKPRQNAEKRGRRAQNKPSGNDAGAAGKDSGTNRPKRNNRRGGARRSSGQRNRGNNTSN
ncbi:DEAD/DEAH box helicase [Salinisphaera sp. Q1T1-3]|uniref:DEAD/DEAH box helicase n=1 Tax=Salinisphaera sp. Q1T1-3 TaxID=2321229 RepID=UPI000E7281D5|nr:DEAD/DEAH box helicase [Salinisphaera sp. Q1T1-3]RJS91353.1 DEAD/DEAH box helicase [Salinisphaera sp. Q1T1-3]